MRSAGPPQGGPSVSAAPPGGPARHPAAALGRRALTVALVGALFAVTAFAVLTATDGATAGSLGAPGVGALATPSAPADSSAPADPSAPLEPADVRTPADPALPSEAGSGTAVTLLAMDGQLDAGLVSSVVGADGVLAATTTRAGNVGLTGSVDADGAPRDVLAAGWRIPVTLLTIDPVGWAQYLAGTLEREDLMTLGRLAPGRVVLSESSARLRGIGEGARVDLAGARDLEVVGVVSDRAAAGYEFVAHLDDAAIVWFGGRETLLVRHHPDASTDIAATIAREELRLPSAARETLRVLRPDDGPRVPLVLGSVAVKERFGEFAFRLVRNEREIVVDPAYVDEWIVTERLPVIGAVKCHRLIMDDLRAAVDELIAAGHEGWLAPRRYAGCYHPRRVSFGRETLSRHSWGIAIDLNVDMTLPGGGAVPPDDMIAIMARHGFRWGGDFTTPDNHHFEWVGEIAALRPERVRTAGS